MTAENLPQPSDPTPPAGTVAPPAAAPLAGTPTPTPAPAPAASPADDASTSEPVSLEEARRLRQEAQSLRRRLREFETAQEQQQRAAMSDAERLRADHEVATQRAATLEAEVRGYRLRDAIEAAVTPATLGEGEQAQPNPLHGVDPRLAARLIDPAALTYGDDGRPQPASVRRALAQALAEFPTIRPSAPTTTAPPPQGTGYVGQRPAGGGTGGGDIRSLAAQQAAALNQQRANAPDPFKRSS